MEIERKFYIRDSKMIEDLKDKYKDTKKTIEQDYIYSDIFTAIRKRKIKKGDTIKYVYTIKTGRKGYSVNEIEQEITENQYNKLVKDKNRNTIIKDRYLIPYINRLIIELDVFHGVYEGIVFAEIEFESEEQAVNADIPEWFDIEIGDLISNDMMSRELVNVKEIIMDSKN